MMGSYLFQHHRNDYAWSIRHGHLSGIEPHHTCPRLRVAQHVAYWGVDKWMAQTAYPFKHLKIGGRPAVLSEVGYGARANALVLAGLCAVPWVQAASRGQPLINSSSGLRRPFGISV